MKKIAIFISGTGSNALNIIEHFDNKSIAEVSCIVSNKSDAALLYNPRTDSFEKIVVSRSQFEDKDALTADLLNRNIDLIVLAGFLWKIPECLIDAFPKRIINIHPALLPKYGGKGMYGMNVHRVVYDNVDSESGMTIHYVNEKYDDGAIIFQARCNVENVNSPEEIGQKVLRLEHQYYSRIIEELL